jgi:4-amino-4-deoxy-L-arabinose transferase-like glycosyltransferase
MPSYIKYFIVVLLAALLFVPFLGNVHLFDWDEINFAECAREMLATGDYLRPQIDFQPFWEKPPLFIWMQVLSMKMFGVNEYAARFPNAIIGILTLVTIFYAGKRILNEKMAAWWALLYTACWLPHFYFKSGIIDPSFNFFIFLAFFQVYLLRFAERKILHALLAGLFLGLAVMTKGPVAILVALLCFVVYMIVNKGLWGYKLPHLLLVAITAAVTFFVWIGVAIVIYGWDYGIGFLNHFITYQIKLFTTEDAGHGGPFFYHWVVLLLGCFPASVFLFQYSRKRVTDNESARDFTKWMWILFSVVLILFSIVKTKIVHYSSLCYFPLTYLAALKLYRISDGQERLKIGVRILMVTIGSIMAILFIAMPYVGMHLKEWSAHVKDVRAAADMQADVSWNYAESIWGVLYLGAVVFAFMTLRVNFRRSMITFFIAQIVLAQVLVLHFTPKIEAISQRPAIEYFKTFRGKDVFVYPLGYYSYAHLFYSQKAPTVNVAGIKDKYELLDTNVGKPVYFISRINKLEEYSRSPQLKILGRKNSYFFMRKVEGMVVGKDTTISR